MCDRVGREPADQRGILLDAFLLVAMQKEVKAARTALLAVRHAVDMLEGKFDIFLPLLLLAQISSGRGHAGVSHAEVCVDIHRLRKTPQGVFMPAV